MKDGCRVQNISYQLQYNNDANQREILISRP